MALARPVQPILATDDELRAALEVADLPPLLPALAQLTGDLSLLRPELRVDPQLMGEEQGGLTPDQQDAIRRLALERLRAYRDGAAVPAPAPDEAALRELLQFMAAGLDIDAYLPMFREELVLTGDLRAPQWRKDKIDPERPFHVAIVGAGMSGIVAAYRLAEAGVSYTVLEKNSDVGGTWLENSYPGCRVDVPNHYYSFSFAQRDDWPLYYSPQAELYEYFRECVNELGIRPNIRFGTEVTSVEWDEDSATWTVCTLAADGREQTIKANAVVSAVGQLNRPQLPGIEGRDSFAGPAFHSARWDHSAQLAGKRVAIIGTGCSTAQFAPHVAQDAEYLEIFQRTPNWQLPRDNYRHEVPGGLQYLLSHIPYYRQWYRFWLFWKSSELLLPAVEVDPDWPDQARSVSQASETLRQFLTEAVVAQYEDRPDLLEKVLPQYPPSAKRLIVDDGTWARMLKRDNVALTTTAIEKIVPEGVLTADGELHRFDVLLYGTGFQPSKFLTPMKVIGRGGVDLHNRWDGDARAFLGITMPDFPNFFMLYGPNTNIVVNGSIIWFSECGTRYIMDCVKQILAGRHRSLEVNAATHDRFNEEVDAANLLRVWGASTVNSWYKNDSGRVAQNWPFTMLRYWQRTREVDLGDYELT